MAIYIGTQVRMQMLLKDYDNADSAGTVTCEVKDPSGNVAAATTSTPRLGTYHAFVTVDEAGVWKYRFESVGTTIAAGESTFTVSSTEFP